MLISFIICFCFMLRSSSLHRSCYAWVNLVGHIASYSILWCTVPHVYSISNLISSQNCRRLTIILPPRMHHVNLLPPPPSLLVNRCPQKILKTKIRTKRTKKLKHCGGKIKQFQKQSYCTLTGSEFKNSPGYIPSLPMDLLQRSHLV